MVIIMNDNRTYIDKIFLKTRRRWLVLVNETHNSDQQHHTTSRSICLFFNHLFQLVYFYIIQLAFRHCCCFNGAAWFDVSYVCCASYRSFELSRLHLNLTVFSLCCAVLPSQMMFVPFESQDPVILFLSFFRKVFFL